MAPRPTRFWGDRVDESPKISRPKVTGKILAGRLYRGYGQEQGLPMFSHWQRWSHFVFDLRVTVVC